MPECLCWMDAPDARYLREVMSRLRGRPIERLTLERLRGDASNRRYYRVRAAGAGAPVVLMQLAEPEAFKQAEERFSRSRLPIQELPYVNILHHLARHGVHVPRLLAYDRPRGLLFLEDLGDLTFEEVATKALASDGQTNHGALVALYRQALEELLRLQGPASRRTATCIAFGRAFDLPLLMWEWDHFLEYGIEAGRSPIRPRDRHRIRQEFERIAQHLATQPRGLTHRDYHSRNLMVRAGTIWVLDFQDALLGPCHYDLASLLRDSYVTLPEKVVDGLLDDYLALKGGRQVGGRKIARPAFRRTFDLMALHRNLKAAGRFAYIHHVKHNSRYLQYIPATLASARRTLEAYPELARLRRLLGAYVEELT